MTFIDEVKGSKVTITHKGMTKSVDIVDLFSINEDDLTKDFIQQASLYAFFSTLQADAERKLAYISTNRDQEYAKSDEYWRAYLDKREKKYTEAVIKSNVIRDEDYTKVDAEYIEMTYEVNIIKSIVKALQMRAEMLISIGAMMRQEISMTGMHINKEFDAATKAVKESISKRKQV